MGGHKAIGTAAAESGQRKAIRKRRIVARTQAFKNVLERMHRNPITERNGRDDKRHEQQGLVDRQSRKAPKAKGRKKKVGARVGRDSAKNLVNPFGAPVGPSQKGGLIQFD